MAVTVQNVKTGLTDQNAAEWEQELIRRWDSERELFTTTTYM